MTIIQKTYPNFFRDFDPEAIEIQSTFWRRSLAEYGWSEVMTAFDYWINTQDRPPSLAQFKAIVAKLKNPEAFISPERAWEAVDSAVRCFGSHRSQEALSTFTEPIKRAVQSVGGWQKICETNLGQSWDFLRKNFMEAYNDFGLETKEQELLPTQVLHRLQQMSAEQIEGPKS